MQNFKKCGIIFVRGIYMEKFSDILLNQVSDYAFSASAQKYLYGEISDPFFQKRLYQLGQNIHASDELKSILFESGYGRLPQKETKNELEQERMRLMKKGLKKIASVPSGRELLSHMPLDIYMYAMVQEDRGFFSSSEKMLSISSRHSTLWVGAQEYLKTFVHEMAHARHATVCQNREYGFSPKAFFFENAFDELGARLQAEKVYGELKSLGYVKSETQKLSVMPLINKMEQSGYFYQFAQSIFNYLGRSSEVVLDEDNLLDKPLKRIFSYYMTLYPQLKQKNVLDKINKIYQKLVLYPAGNAVGLTQYDVSHRLKQLGYGSR